MARGDRGHGSFRGGPRPGGTGALQPVRSAAGSQQGADPALFPAHRRHVAAQGRDQIARAVQAVQPLEPL